MKRGQFKFLIITALLFHSLGAIAEEYKGLFRESRNCGLIIAGEKSASGDDYGTCMTSYPFQLSTDIFLAPFILTAKAQASSTYSGESSEKRKDEVKQYKQTMLYAVSEDAVYYNASPDHEPSVALQSFINNIAVDFPGESIREINARIVQTHMDVLRYLDASLND